VDPTRADAGDRPPADAGTDPDAQSGDADALDGAASDADAHDASHDAAVPLPGLRNPEFELPSDASAPFELFAQNGVPADWYACRPDIRIVSSASTSAGKVTRPDGSMFIADGLNAISVPQADQVQGGLMQQLSEPLHAGESYALLLDVRTDLGAYRGEIELKLGTGVLKDPTAAFSCLLSGITEFASTGPIAPGAWVTRCLSFTPTQDASSLVLLGSAPGNLFGITQAQLFIDDIRRVERCP
jgi:hypothetical protein